MDITIEAWSDYLNDVEFWAYFVRSKADGAYVALAATEQAVLYESGNLIDSIEIFADS